jgi:hypothetical protein
MLPTRLTRARVYGSYYGNAFFGGGGDGDAAEFSVAAFMDDMKSDTLATLLAFRFTLLHAVYMWAVVLPVLTAAIYVVLTPLLTLLMPKNAADKKSDKRH